MRTSRAIARLVPAVLVLAACGASDGDTSAKRAEAKVTAKERALSDAQSASTEATTAFCGASKTYIVGLDRYGDVLNASSPTVGDVKEAGADLTEPREETTEAAEAAVEAQQELVTAEQELADAQAALAKVQASSGGPTGTTITSKAEPTTKPPRQPASETVNRVKQAESEFGSTVQGITDQTPLVQASQEFNAAAVALEMSWLSLYADAGCLTKDEHKQAETAVSDYTSSLQQSLTEAGYYQGQVDGVYGPQTVAAVEALQQAHGIPVTGTVDKATAAALEADLLAKGGAAAEEALASTAAVQQTLHLAGFWDGPVDGEWTPELTEALESFQTELGVKPTGTVDAATIAALEDAIANPAAAARRTRPHPRTQPPHPLPPPPPSHHEWNRT